jgi:hypothetical protein
MGKKSTASSGKQPKTTPEETPSSGKEKYSIFEGIPTHCFASRVDWDFCN